MVLKKRAERIGYCMEMCEHKQYDRQFSRRVYAFWIGGGGPHPNPAVGGYADEKAFLLDPQGLQDASNWLAIRETRYE